MRSVSRLRDACPCLSELCQVPKAQVRGLLAVAVGLGPCADRLSQNWPRRSAHCGGQEILRQDSQNPRTIAVTSREQNHPDVCVQAERFREGGGERLCGLSSLGSSDLWPRRSRKRVAACAHDSCLLLSRCVTAAEGVQIAGLYQSARRPARQHPTAEQARSEHGQKKSDKPVIKRRPEPVKSQVRIGTPPGMPRGTARYRLVSGHPSKHGANMEQTWMRPVLDRCGDSGVCGAGSAEQS
jgi:hypothetical protein